MANIVHFGKYYLPDSGGIESVTASLAKGSVNAGNVVTVVCFEKSPSTPNDVIDGVNVVRAPIAKLIASQPLGLNYFFSSLSAARNADIVHLHAPNMLGALCSLFIKRKTRLLVHWHSDVVNKGLLGKLVRPLEKALLWRADSILATSQVYAEASETLAPFKSKIAVVPIGVPDTKLGGAEKTLPSHIEQSIQGKKIILSVGRLVPYKGFEVLIDAAKDLIEDAIIVIVGAGPLIENLRNHIASAHAHQRVILTGRLSDHDLHSLFSRASLYCLPSTYRAEAFGVVLLEAMAHGLPIVATDIPGSGVPWVNQHGVSGLNVPVNNSSAIADACNHILESSDLRRRLVNGARQRFLSEFTEEVFIKRVLSIYERLLTDIRQGGAD
ncbi:glycosyltransferase [uncultured Limnobacter sp.]|uniref:glycosyltransferase n=1 Tax=uncultured Limnobacter sp. TaxID=199681 RepID=UPI0030F85A91